MADMRAITGYRELTPGEIDMINAIKAHEQSIGEVWALVANSRDTDDAWLEVARVHFVEAFSAMTRSVAKPHDPFTR
jgi:hypothetical protein